LIPWLFPSKDSDFIAIFEALNGIGIDKFAAGIVKLLKRNPAFQRLRDATYGRGRGCIM
jgi:hypothetical protein